MYNPLNWNSSGKGYCDPNMFAFSLTENIKCMVKKEKNCGIYCDSNRGPYSYALGFGCDNDSMNNPYIYGDNYYNDLDKLNVGKQNGHVKVTEVEIFAIQILD